MRRASPHLYLLGGGSQGSHGQPRGQTAAACCLSPACRLAVATSGTTTHLKVALACDWESRIQVLRSL